MLGDGAQRERLEFAAQRWIDAVEGAGGGIGDLERRASCSGARGDRTRTDGLAPLRLVRASRDGAGGRGLGGPRSVLRRIDRQQSFVALVMPVARQRLRAGR